MSTNLVTELGAGSAVTAPSASASLGLWTTTLHEPSLTEVLPVAIVWLILFGGALFVGVSFLRQILVMWKRGAGNDSRTRILLRLAASSKVAGWIALGVGLAMTGCGFRWTLISTLECKVDTVFLALCTYQCCIYGFMGLLVWVVSMLQGALATLWELRHLPDQTGRDQQAD